MTPTIERAVGEGNLVEGKPVMGGEDFAHYAQKVPGFFMFLGVHDPSSATNPRATHPPTSCPTNPPSRSAFGRWRCWRWIIFSVKYADGSHGRVTPPAKQAVWPFVDANP